MNSHLLIPLLVKDQVSDYRGCLPRSCAPRPILPTRNINETAGGRDAARRGRLCDPALPGAPPTFDESIHLSTYAPQMPRRGRPDTRAGPAAQLCCKCAPSHAVSPRPAAPVTGTYRDSASSKTKNQHILAPESRFIKYEIASAAKTCRNRLPKRHSGAFSFF